MKTKEQKILINEIIETNLFHHSPRSGSSISVFGLPLVLMSTTTIAIMAATIAIAPTIIAAIAPPPIGGLEKFSLNDCL